MNILISEEPNSRMNYPKIIFIDYINKIKRFFIIGNYIFLKFNFISSYKIDCIVKKKPNVTFNDIAGNEYAKK